MTWHMETDPLNSTLFSALLAAVPIAVMFWALAIKRTKGHVAALYAVISAFLVAVIGYGMPVYLAALATLYGMLFGIFPIVWIVVTAVFLFNVTVKAGQFDIIKNSIASITDDRRLQALLIAFSFGSFLEGAAGFGAPVAITAAMLGGLGFDPLYAAGICLLANTAPVAFGAIGIPIIVAGQVSGIDVMAISELVGFNLLFLSVIIPFYFVTLMAGWRKMVEIWPAILVSGLSFGIAQWWTAATLGPFLPDIIASAASIILLTVFLRLWRPATSWRFAREPAGTGTTGLQYTGRQIFRAWAPFIILILFVAAWGMTPVKQTLDYIASATFEIPGLHHMVIKEGRPMPAVFTFNYLSAAGTAILLSALVTMLMLKVPLSEGRKVFADTVRAMRLPIITIAGVLGFAYLSNFSGISITLGNAFAGTGALFPFFSPFIGWLGVFITGSDTSANALFGKLQQVTASRIPIDPVVAVAANNTGGVTAKMISPQSIAVATAAVDLSGREADIFRSTLKHSIILTLAVGIMTVLEAYVFTGVLPDYARTAATTKATTTEPALNVAGIVYLGIALLLILLTFFTVRAIGRKGYIRYR
ncbi:MAG: L-lactate permease [Nitrospirota bacterium]